MAFRQVKKHYKPNENEVSQKPKTRCENPYKPVENEDILSPKRKMASKMIKKALGLSL